MKTGEAGYTLPGRRRFSCAITDEHSRTRARVRSDGALVSQQKTDSPKGNANGKRQIPAHELLRDLTSARRVLAEERVFI